MHLKEIKIIPVGYVRRTRADAWKKRPAVLRYYAYLDELRLKLNNFELGNAFEEKFGIDQEGLIEITNKMLEYER